MIQFRSWDVVPVDFTGCARVQSPHNSIVQFVNGRIHSRTGPARIDEDGDTYWYHHDKIHRVDGPARVWKKTQKNAFYINGVFYDDQKRYWSHPLVLEHKFNTILTMATDDSS